mgnify:CR=1 FL=1
MINYSDPQTRYLIDYTNLKQELIKIQRDKVKNKIFLENNEIKNIINILEK